MKSWELYGSYDCIKYKDFSDLIIKTDECVAGLWVLVWFGGYCDIYITVVNKNHYKCKIVTE